MKQHAAMKAAAKDTTLVAFDYAGDGQDASASEITFNAQSLLGPNYLRITVPLTGAVPLDDFSTAAYATMDASLESFYRSPAYAQARAWLQANFPTS